MGIFLRNTVYCIFVFIILNRTASIGQEYTVVPADRPAYEKERMAIVYTQKKQRTDWNYLLQGGVVTAKRYKESLHFYNALGLIEETIFLDTKGIKKSIAMYEYNSNSLPQTVNEYSPLGNQLSKIVYRYTQQGYLFDVHKYKGESDLLSRTLFSVNKEEATVTQREYSAADSLLFKQIYHYTNLDSGKVSRVDTYINKDSLFVYYKVSYEKDKRVEKEEYFTSNNEAIFSIEYNYFPNGKLANKMRTETSGRKRKSVEYHYNDLLLLSGEILYNHEGGIRYYYRYSYE